MKTLIAILLIAPLSMFCQDKKDSLSRGEDSSKVNVMRLSINSSSADFAPQIAGSTLMFVSGREQRYGIVYERPDGEQDMTDLFQASKTDSVTFRNAKAFEAVNSKYNEGPFSISQDGNTLYFSTNDREGSGHESKGLKIYTASKIKGHWQKPAPAGFCSTGSAYCHPALMQNDSKLLFASDMPGGFGGMDLYVTEYKNGTWSAPVNLGGTVNSASNEVFPFVSKNILFFSSDRKTGLGGLDLYKLDMNDPIDNTLEHLDVPLNSPSDDFGIWTDSLQAGYMCSNRVAGFSDDIYYFYTAVPDFSQAVTPDVKSKFCYTFFEESLQDSSDNKNMTYEWDFGDGAKARKLETKHCYNRPGLYHVQLNIVEAASGELFYNETSYDLQVDTPKQLLIAAEDTIAAGQALAFDASRSALEGYTMLKYYWLFGDNRYNSGSFVKHIYRESGCYTVELGVLAKNEATGKIEKFKLTRKIVVRDHT